MRSRARRLISPALFATASGGGGGGTTTFDTAYSGALITFSGSNLIATNNGGANVRSVASHTAGLLYHQFTINAIGSGSAYVMGVGIMGAACGAGTALGTTVDSGALFNGDTNFYVGNASVGNTGISLAAGDVIDTATDIGHQNIWFRKNGGNWNSSGTANPVTNTGGLSFAGITNSTYYAAALIENNGPTQITADFGGSAYAHTPPSGFGNW